MWRNILIVIAAAQLGTAAWMWAAPLVWYETVPGVGLTGPFNPHFVRDVALTFLVSGIGLMWGALRRNITALVFGVAWPMFHALYHLWIWGGRGLVPDQVAIADLVGIQLPVWLTVLAIVQISEQEART